MHTSPDSFVRRVRAHLDALPETERQLADFLLQFPGELAGYAGNELAELAGVSPSTVSRFFRRIGYASYEEARRHVREERASGSPLFQAASAGRGGQSTLLAHLQHAQANLQDSFARLGDAQLMDIARAIVAAPQVLIFGSRSSHGFAVYLRWQLIQVVPRVTALPGPGETLAEHLVGLDARDVVIVFGTRRQTRQVDVMLEAAEASRAKVLFISDLTTADRAGATWSLQLNCRGPGPLDNHVAVVALCDALATLVIEVAGAGGRKRMAAIEMAHEDAGEL